MQIASLAYTVACGEQEGTAIVTLIGPLILYNLFEVQKELRMLRDPVLIVDLEQLPYMDSAGLGLLMNTYVSATSNGRRFLVANVNERVQALLSMMRVDEVLPMFPSVEAAEASVKLPGRGTSLRPPHAVRYGRTVP